MELDNEQKRNLEVEFHEDWYKSHRYPPLLGDIIEWAMNRQYHTDSVQIADLEERLELTI